MAVPKITLPNGTVEYSILFGLIGSLTMSGVGLFIQQMLKADSYYYHLGYHPSDGPYDPPLGLKEEEWYAPSYTFLPKSLQPFALDYWLTHICMPVNRILGAFKPTDAA